jgi:hypothetical protein
MFRRTGRVAVLGALLAIAAGTGTAFAHESRDLDDINIVVGFRNEPVFAGEESGLEFFVSHAGEPVEGLEETLQAEVMYGDDARDLELSPRFGEPGGYESVFFPTAAGQYSFRIWGEIDGEPIDETFTSGPETFGDVQEVAGGQFPVVYPATADVVAAAETGEAAATTATVALVAGIAGLVAGLVAIGLTLARRRA